MFKCKQCGRQFGANTPAKCPECGAANKSDERPTKGILILSAIAEIGCIAELILVFLIVSAMTALVAYFL